MGGEPTFVSIDDMDGAEWNTAALGENKRARAGGASAPTLATLGGRRSDAPLPGQMVPG